MQKLISDVIEWNSLSSVHFWLSLHNFIHVSILFHLSVSFPFLISLEWLHNSFWNSTLIQWNITILFYSDYTYHHPVHTNRIESSHFISISLLNHITIQITIYYETIQYDPVHSLDRLNSIVDNLAICQV